jgi:hypothetical protein
VPRLNWDLPGEHYYETGIDRGVLYVPVHAGVAWSGLTSVAESPSGGDAKPYYLDGVKYLNLSAAEEFEATISSFYSPAEFAACDGMSQIHNGLMATQQPRQSFGLSYRTLLGNDTEGPEFAYKIHLVYNALAAPASKTSTTIGSSADPTDFSWDITTLPPPLTGYKPTAHLIIDSSTTDPAVLSEVEDIIYGSVSSSARQPTPDELVAIFAP